MPKDTESFKVTVTLSRPHKPWRGKNVMINWPGWEHPLAIHIYPKTAYNREKEIDEIIRYEVSWSALGAVPFLQARRYAYAIEQAATEAKLLTDKYAGKDYK